MVDDSGKYELEVILEDALEKKVGIVKANGCTIWNRDVDQAWTITFIIASSLWFGVSILCGIQYGTVWGMTLLVCSPALGLVFGLLLVLIGEILENWPLGSGWQKFVAAAKARVPYAERHENERRDRAPEASEARHIKISLDASRTDPTITVSIAPIPLPGTDQSEPRGLSFILRFAIREEAWVCEKISYAIYGIQKGCPSLHIDCSAPGISELRIYREVFEELFVTDT